MTALDFATTREQSIREQSIREQSIREHHNAAHRMAWRFIERREPVVAAWSLHATTLHEHRLTHNNGAVMSIAWQGVLAQLQWQVDLMDLRRRWSR